jgi:hypothetical protein
MGIGWPHCGNDPKRGVGPCADTHLFPLIP